MSEQERREAAGILIKTMTKAKTKTKKGDFSALTNSKTKYIFCT